MQKTVQKPKNSTAKTMLKPLRSNGFKEKGAHNAHELIFQHNHITEARYNFSLQEKRLLLWLSSRIKPDDEEFKEHILSIRELANLCGIVGRSIYEEVPKTTLGLMKKIAVIRKIDEQKIIQTPWLTYAEYDFKKGQICLQFSPKLKPFFLHLKEQFTVLPLETLIKFKSVYAMRLFELLTQYKALESRTITIEDLRGMLGISETKHKEFKSLNRDVLKPAQKEIQKRTDMRYEMEMIKDCRKVVAIKFVILPKESEEIKRAQAIEKEMKPTKRSPLIDQLMEYGISRSKAYAVVGERTEQEIENAMATTDWQMKKGKIKNVKAFLLAALKEKWKP